jgi:murein DD-endopeptidase MepM/ murein hydrolase activator NlpD
VPRFFAGRFLFVFLRDRIEKDGVKRILHKKAARLIPTTKIFHAERKNPMNYSEKRTLIGRIVYIGLTVMAVTILCVTLYTFFGGANKAKNPTPMPSGTEAPATEAPDTDKRPTVTPDTDDRPTGVEPPPSDTDSKPTVTPPAKDWTKLKVLMPVDGVVVKRHDMVNAVFSVTMNDYRVHQGVDIECDVGADVMSCAYGTVKTVGQDPFMGCTIVIDHGDGLLSYYRNLSEELADGIEVGATVYGGQLLGTVGETAIIEIADEPHLHFELELNGKLVDPMLMLDYDAKTSTEDAAKDDK